MPGPGKTISLTVLFSLLLLIVTIDKALGATYQLCNLLQAGGTVPLSSADTYQLSGQCNLTRSVTILGNGITISGIGPIVASGVGLIMTVDHLAFNSSGWAALAAVNSGSVIVQNNSAISCPSGTGLYGDTGSSVTVQSSSISAYYGVQIKNASSAHLHGLTVTNAPYAVMISGVGSSVTIDGNSLLNYSGAGAGVALMDGASGVVHDSTINGFTNGIDIHPTGATIYNGTVDVLNCMFDHNNGSALAASYGTNISFSTSTVTNAVMDGLYFNNSTAVIDKSQIIGSLNTGVSFIGCSGGTIQNSLVKDNIDQGVSVVAQNSSSPPSLNIKVLNNTFVNNQIANLLIDDRSTAQIQGNVFTKTPDADIRFHGSQGITLDSALVTDSMSGMEIYGSNSKIVLSDITQSSKNGILVYNNSSLTAEHSLFWNNGLTAPAGSSDLWSIFVNTGADVYARSCAFGPTGKWALYNNSTALCDVTWNYWDAVDGPNVASWILPQGAVNGSGALLQSSYIPLGPVIYTPSFLTQSPVSTSINESVSLPTGRSLTWNSQLGLTIGLTANLGSTALSNEILGVLRVNDTVSLRLVSPPANLLPGELYVVWVSAPLRLNSASGYLQFNLPSQNGVVDLMRRKSDGSWTFLSSVWDQASHMLTFTPADVGLLNGTFAITNPNVIYAMNGGGCSSKTPCFSCNQNGINSLQTNTIMYVTQDTFTENVVYNFPAVLILAGGYDSTYANQLSSTVIRGSLTIKDGQMIVENVTIK